MSTRVVLLGASNLALDFPAIVRRLAAGLPRPLEIFAAIGHGRSYCDWSRVLFRGLPGIGECRLWDDLVREPGGGSPTLALLTDVGNDLLYGAAPAAIAARVEACLARLAERQAELVVTRLPLASIERLSAPRFYATKAAFFPRSGGSLAQLLERARQVDDALAEAAGRYGARLIEQPRHWYGFDPIHIRHRRRDEAWRTMFSGWTPFAAGEAGPWSLALRDRLRLRLAAPAERRLFGRLQQRAQPGLVLDDIPIRLY